MTRWFTADMHIGHRRIIELCGRPFASVREMDAIILINWHERVAACDEVYVLGDMVMGDFRSGIERVARLPGRKFLIPGNHDRCHSVTGQDEKRVMYEDAGFTVLPETVYVPVLDQLVLASHFPYVGDSHDTDRYAACRPVDKGEWLLHGHVHKKWRINWRQINVGVDAWNFQLVSEQEIAERMNRR